MSEDKKLSSSGNDPGRGSTGAVLEPCPFCGSDRVTVWGIRDGARAVCKDCKAEGAPEFHGPTTLPSADHRAREAWNRRAPHLPDPPEGQ